MSLTEEILFENRGKKILPRLDSLPVSAEVPELVQWAEDNRYLPAGVSEYHGPFERTTAPHMVEPLNRLHPDDPCTHIALMKSVQSTATTSVAENGMGAWIAYKLGSILALTSSKGIAKIRSSSAIDVMIDHSGLASSLKPMSQRMKRKTADTSFYKEFAGGIKLLMSSYNSIGDLKSNTFHFIIRDEWDEAPAELKDQGDIAGIIEGRTMGLRHFKILDISTPSRMETSRIYKSYMEGDQRKYFVPCPICGEHQVLVLKGEGRDYGLTFNMTKDDVTGKKVLDGNSVRYICQHCKGEFRESKKSWMLQNGLWKPTAVPIDRKKTSYHVSGLLSPEMFLSWERICQQFVNTKFGEDLLKFKDFKINYLGEPWASVQKIASWEEIKNRAEEYAHGIVPKGEEVTTAGMPLYRGPLILTAGVDVQKDRLEMHVVGFGFGMEKWSIDYQIFYGDPSNLDDVCWVSLENWIYQKAYNILGKEHLISLCAIDSGYDPKSGSRTKDWGNKSSVVYEFVALRPDRFVAIMGVTDDKAIDTVKEARIYGQSTLKKRYNVAVSMIKESIMAHIDVTSGPKAIHFPKYRMVNGEQKLVPDDFYKQFMSERYQELSPNKFGWKKIRERNEVWDTFIYAWAAAELNNIHTWTAELWSLYYTQSIEVQK